MDLLTANDRDGEYPASYHAATVAPLAPFAPARGALAADVCVIGGGYTGLSAALHLAERGYDVVLVEAQRVGFGASGRNGGQVGTGQRRDQDALEAMLGRDRARALWQLSLDAVGLVRDLVARHAIACGYCPGIVHAEHRASGVAHAHAYAGRLAAEYGYADIRPLDRDALGDLVGSPAYHGGTLDMGGGHLDPLAYALGLARAAVRAGVRIHEASRVLGYAPGDPVRVRTDGARIAARHLLLACNGYLGGLAPAVARRVMPINNYIVATEPLGDRAPEILPGNHAVADSKFVINYFRLSGDRRLLFGGRESYGYRFPADIAAKVRRPMARIYPQLAEIPITHAWGGTLAITRNRMPYFARLAGNVLTATGYSGHGVAMATLGGRLAAEAVAGQAERFDLMAAVPTPSFPGGAALRWPLLVAGMLWFSLRDRL